MHCDNPQRVSLKVLSIWRGSVSGVVISSDYGDLCLWLKAALASGGWAGGLMPKLLSEDWLRAGFHLAQLPRKNLDCLGLESQCLWRASYIFLPLRKINFPPVEPPSKAAQVGEKRPWESTTYMAPHLSFLLPGLSGWALVKWKRESWHTRPKVFWARDFNQSLMVYLLIPPPGRKRLMVGSREGLRGSWKFYLT